MFSWILWDYESCYDNEPDRYYSGNIIGPIDINGEEISGQRLFAPEHQDIPTIDFSETL